MQSTHSAMGYVPNYPANIVGAVLFGLVTVSQFLFGIICQDWWMWVTWTICGGLELLTYIGRIIIYKDPLSAPMWEMQFVCAIIAPAFMSAGLYYQLAVEIVIFGDHYSRIPPMIYNAIFTTCDVIALIIQAAGGGYAVSDVDSPETTKNGAWIMVGGISFQVLTLAVFIIIFAVVNFRIYRDNPSNWNHEFSQNRQRKLFKFWLPAVSISLLFLLIRSIYRIVELSEGWNSRLLLTERYFLVLDGLMILIGMGPLCIVYPAFATGYIPVPGLHRRATRKRKAELAALLEEEKKPALNF